MSGADLPPGWAKCFLGDVIRYGETHKAEPEEIEPDAWVLELEDIEKDTSRILRRTSFSRRQSKSTKNRLAASNLKCNTNRVRCAHGRTSEVPATSA